MSTDRVETGLNRRAFTGMAAAGIAAGLGGSALAGGADKVASAHSSSPAAFTALRGRPISIGMLVFPRLDQIDFTGPFAVLARLPDATVHVIGTQAGPITDHLGLVLTTTCTLADVPALDLLVVTGGPGQEALMDHEPTLALIRAHAAAGKPIFSVCTGALICGAAGILKGRNATTHWAAFDLLTYFGARPVSKRVVTDGNLVSAAGLTAGIDGALTVASLLRGDEKAQQIELDIQYAPEPLFNSGLPETASPAVLAAAKAKYRPITEARLATAQKYAARSAAPVT